jgi:hypothetical protein
LEPVVAKEKRLVEARDAIRDAHAGRAKALDRLGRHAEAVQDWGKALEWDTGQNRTILQLGRAISQAYITGDHATALTAVESLAKESDGPTLEGLARLCALAAAAGGESYAARAVELLRQAAGKGHRDTAYLKDGSDLTSLHSRADFQNLLSKSGANE